MSGDFEVRAVEFTPYGQLTRHCRVLVRACTRLFGHNIILYKIVY